jgi:hypothetical protein
MSLLFGTFLIRLKSLIKKYFPHENLGLFERRHPELGLGIFFSTVQIFLSKVISILSHSV